MAFDISRRRMPVFAGGERATARAPGPATHAAPALQSVMGAKGAPSPADVRSLQRAVGNRVVQRLLARPPAGGEPLPAVARREMEGAFQTSFADVRVHVGSEADAMEAEAYTRGSHIHFSPGRYNPSSRTGKALLGHELAHVLQQRAGRVPAPPGAIHHDAHLEAEADALGARAAAGGHVGPSAGRAAASALPRGEGAVQRKITRGAAGLPNPVREAIGVEDLDDLVDRLLANPALAVKHTRSSASALQGDALEKVMRKTVEALHRATETYSTEAALVDAAKDGLHTYLQISSLDWGRDDLASVHPERDTFINYLQETKVVEDPKRLWDQTISGVQYQRELIQSGNKHAPNPEFEGLSKALAPLLRAPRGAKVALWSGGFDVSLYAQERGFVTLESTTAGRLFNALKLHPSFDPLGALWNNLSREFVRSLSGEVHVFIRTADKESVLFRQELDQLFEQRVVREIHWHVLEGDKAADLHEVMPEENEDSKPGHDSVFSAVARMEPRRIKDMPSQERPRGPLESKLLRHLVQVARRRRVVGDDADESIILRTRSTRNIWAQVLLNLENDALVNHRDLAEKMEQYIDEAVEDLL